MGIFSFLKSNKKTVDKVVDGAISGIDKIFYTNEERSEARRKLAEGVQEFVTTTLDENTARSRTRRVIAIMIMGVFLLLIVGAAIAFPWSSDYSNHLFEIAESMSTFALMVAAFFFGAHMLGRNLVEKKKKK